MSCSNIPAKIDTQCKPIRQYAMKLKPYVYEIVNGKRKRVSPFVFSEDGKTIIEIKKRAIIETWLV